MHKHDPVAYTISETCSVSGLGKSSIYEAIARKELRAVKMGRRTLVLAKDLKAWLESQPEAKISYFKPQN